MGSVAFRWLQIVLPVLCLIFAMSVLRDEQAAALSQASVASESESEVTPDSIISRETAMKYRKEVQTGRANRGTGAPLDASQIAFRVVSLGRRNASLST